MLERYKEVLTTPISGKEALSTTRNAFKSLAQGVRETPFHLIKGLEQAGSQLKPMVTRGAVGSYKILARFTPFAVLDQTFKMARKGVDEVFRGKDKKDKID